MIKPEIAILLGVYIGDGWISKFNKQIKLSINVGKDKDFGLKLVKLLHKLGHDGRMYLISQKYYHVQSYTFWQIIEKYYPKGKKSTSVEIPKNLMGKRKLLSFILRGIFSTDGSFPNTKKKYISFDTTSKKLAVDIYQILRLMDIKGYFYVFNRKRKLPSGKITPLTLYSVRIWSSVDILKFIREIGSINPSHIEKFNLFTAGVAKSGQRRRMKMRN